MIVEGPDGAGKTTLINRLSRDFGIPVKDWDQDRNSMAETGLFRRTFGALGYEVSSSNAEPPVFYDRLYFSELVYGTVLRNEVRFSDYQLNLVERTLEGLRIPIIFCRPPLEVVQANVAASAGLQLEGVAAHVEALWNTYATHSSRWKIQSLTYDYTGRTNPSSNYERVCKQVERYLKRRALRTWQSSTTMSSSAPQ